MALFSLSLSLDLSTSRPLVLCVSKWRYQQAHTHIPLLCNRKQGGVVKPLNIADSLSNIDLTHEVAIVPIKRSHMAFASTKQQISVAQCRMCSR